MFDIRYKAIPVTFDHTEGGEKRLPGSGGAWTSQSQLLRHL